MFTFLLVSLFIEASMVMPVQARMNILERDGRAIYMRRLGLNPPVLDELRTTCAGICDSLALNATNALLANAGECDQQDVADKLIDVARAQKDSSVTDNLISLAIEYRETEKNTPVDDSVSPPVFRNSVYCQKAPKNAELKGLVQSQDPENDPNAFFDPAKPDKTVKLGDQPNTFHFDTAEDDSCEPPSDPTNGGQNGGGNNDDNGAGGNDDDGAGGNDDDGAGGDGNGAGGNDDGAGGDDDDTGGDDDCNDNDGWDGDGQQPGDGEGDDDDCDEDPQDGPDPQGPDSPDNGEDAGNGNGNAGGGYGGGDSGQDGGAPATTAEAPGGYRTGTASTAPVPTLTQSSEGSASPSVDPETTTRTAPPTSHPKQTFPVASSSTPTATTSLSSSSATSITPSITPTSAPTTVSTSPASPSPTASDPSAVLLTNGKAAQQLNALFVSNPLKEGDRCFGSEVACLGGNVDLGICTQGKFKTFSCAASGGSCFAIPQTSARGTSSTCITPSDALKLIAASGAGNSLTPV